MALHTVKGTDNVPQNCVLLGRSEALRYQKEIVRDWKNPTDVIFLRNGKYLAGALTCVSSIFIVKHLRQMYNLGTKLAALTYYPNVIFGPLAIMIVFDSSVTNNVLIMEMKCPLCWQLKYTVKQLLAGVVLPFVAGNIICGFSATVKQTLFVPDVAKEPKKFFQIIHKFYKNGALTIKVLASLHLISAVFWPYMQNIELAKITNTLHEETKIYDELLHN